MTDALTAPLDGAMTEATTDDEIVRLWLSMKRSPNTVRAYERDASEFRAIVGKPLRAVKLEDMLRYRDVLQERFKLATVDRKLSAIRSLFTFAERVRYLQVNVAAAVATPAGQRDKAQRILTEAEVHRILDAARAQSFRAFVAVSLLYYGGLRADELCSLRYRDIRVERTDALRCYITVRGKGAKYRTVRVPPLVGQRALLLAFDASEPGPFARTPSSLRRLFAAIVRASGVPKPVTPHWMRHAHSAHAHVRGASLRLIQRSLGHESITTTADYVATRPEDSSGLYLPV